MHDAHPERRMLENAISVANATINTAINGHDEPQRPASPTAALMEKKNQNSKQQQQETPLKRNTGLSIEKMESMTALAFDPRKSRPGPKRGSLLVKQGFTNLGSKQTIMSDPMSQKRENSRLTIRQ